MLYINGECTPCWLVDLKRNFMYCFIWYSMSLISDFYILTNNQQPTTNNQQPTTNNQQPTTNNQQPTTNHHSSNLDDNSNQRSSLASMVLIIV